MKKKDNKLNNKNNHYSIDDYISIIYSNCEKKLPSTKNNLSKIEDENIDIPNVENYKSLMNYNYNLQQLKKFAKNYKLKISGNKKELFSRIFTFLLLSSHIIKIQKVFRGIIQRNYNYCRGPGFKNRKLCNNNSDFITMEGLDEIDNIQFFSYRDLDDFIYGFDLVSVYHLVFKHNKNKNIKPQIENPYNRNLIPDFVSKNIKSLIRLSKILKIPINLEVENDYEVSKSKSVELNALSLFQTIDSLGNYTNSQWFLSLNRTELVKFMRELVDIWNYRAQLSQEIKSNIYPPNGNPFSSLNIGYLHTENDLNNVKNYILRFCEKLVNSGINNDSKTLGAYYVLGALCLVSPSAAEALPWLYQSVSIF